MGPFESLEIKSFTSNFFNNLNPLIAPHYFIIIAIDIAIVYTCEHITGNNWGILFFFLIALQIALLRYAYNNKIKATAKEVLAQLRIARVTGISLAIIGLVYTSNQTQHTDELFFTILSACAVQVAFYLIYNEAKYLQISENDASEFYIFNIPQFTLILNSLLITFFCLASDYSLHTSIVNINKQIEKKKSTLEENSSYEAIIDSLKSESNYLIVKSQPLSRKLEYFTDGKEDWHKQKFNRIKNIIGQYEFAVHVCGSIWLIAFIVIIGESIGLKSILQKE